MYKIWEILGQKEIFSDHFSFSFCVPFLVSQTLYNWASLIPCSPNRRRAYFWYVSVKKEARTLIYEKHVFVYKDRPVFYFFLYFSFSVPLLIPHFLSHFSVWGICFLTISQVHILTIDIFILAYTSSWIKPCCLLVKCWSFVLLHKWSSMALWIVHPKLRQLIVFS